MAIFRMPYPHFQNPENRAGRHCATHADNAMMVITGNKNIQARQRRAD